MIDAWLLINPATWAAITPQGDESWDYCYRMAVTGHWKTVAGKEVYNLVGSESEIQGVIDALEAETSGSVEWLGEWGQGSGNATRAGNHFNVPADVIAAQKDIIEYDQDGNPISSTPPTIAAPNYAHQFLGQKPRRAGGAFSKGFSKGFL